MFTSFSKPKNFSSTLPRIHRKDASSTFSLANSFFIDAKSQSIALSRSFINPILISRWRAEASCLARSSCAFVEEDSHFETSSLVIETSSTTCPNDANFALWHSIFFCASVKSYRCRTAFNAKPGKACNSEALLSKSPNKDATRSRRTHHYATCTSTLTLRPSS